jgi:hypothetical protein
MIPHMLCQVQKEPWKKNRGKRTGGRHDKQVYLYRPVSGFISRAALFREYVALFRAHAALFCALTG